ncbi:MAG: hypothetical protein IT497_05005 [Ottowia sp.]|nr:hypothetical protein [Ottowia sp.]
MPELKKEIVYLGPKDTAKTLVLVYVCFSTPIILFALLAAFVRYGEMPVQAILSALVLNTLVGFGLLWFACKVYNWVAKKFGGIQFVVRDMD